MTTSSLPLAQGLYDPRNEHDACGVGLVASLDGKPSRAVTQAGIDAPAWSKLRTNGTVAYIDVPAPGDYAIGLWMREDGVSVVPI